MQRLALGLGCITIGLTVAVVSAERTPAPAAVAGAREAVRELTIPAGTNLPIVLDTRVGSDISRVEQPVRAHLARSVSVAGRSVLPAGTIVSGVVTNARRSARVKGRAHVALRFDTLTLRGTEDRYPIRTTAIGRTAAATKGKDALEIGGPAAGGAIIGALAGGRKGALIGATVGGGAGTAVVLSTRGKEIHMAKGSRLNVRLTAPVLVRVPS